MIIGNNIGINNNQLNITSKSGGYKNVREYSKYLLGKYSCLTPGSNVAVSVTPGMLRKAKGVGKLEGFTYTDCEKWKAAPVGYKPDRNYCSRAWRSIWPYR